MAMHCVLVNKSILKKSIYMFEFSGESNNLSFMFSNFIYLYDLHFCDLLRLHDVRHGDLHDDRHGDRGRYGDHDVLHCHDGGSSDGDGIHASIKHMKC